MKKGHGLLSFLLSLSTAVAFAQSNYRLEMERSVQDSSLRIDVFIRKTSGPDFALGASNFDIDLKSPSLDLAHAKFLPGDFDASTHPESYEALGTSSGNGLVMNVNPFVKGTGTGELVSINPKRIGSVVLPITEPCATVSPTWGQSSAAINRYTKSSALSSIMQSASYVNPAAIDLDGGISKSIPSVSLRNKSLVSSSKTNNQWYLDGVMIPGARDSVFTPIVEGSYSVEVSYPCAKNMSAAYSVISTGLSNFSLSYNFVAQPNPFVGECSIQYTLASPSVIKLQLFDVNGIFKRDLETGAKQQGQHEFSFKASEIGLAAGTYVLKLSVGDRLGTLKIVALK